MQKPTHIMISSACAWLTFLLNPVFSIFYLLVPFLAILPDADHGQDSITKKLGFKIVPWKHRWWSHTVYFPFVVMGIFYLLSHFFNLWLVLWDYIVLWIIIFSHTLWDMFTVSGIRPFYVPWMKNFISEMKVKIPLATTWHSSEYVVLAITTWAFLFLMYRIISSGAVNIFLEGYKNFMNNTELALFPVIFLAITGLILLFFLGKELLSFKENTFVILKYFFKLLWILFITWIVAFIAYYFLNKNPNGMLVVYWIGAIWLWYIGVQFFKNIELLMPMIAYTIIWTLYFSFFLIFVRYFNF